MLPAACTSTVTSLRIGSRLTNILSRRPSAYENVSAAGAALGVGQFVAGLTGAALVWVYRRHPAAYRPFRNTLFLANAIAVVGYWLGRDVRERVPGVNVLVHPECKHEVVTAADYVGSTEYIIRTVAEAPAGSAWSAGATGQAVQFAPHVQQNRIGLAHPDRVVDELGRGEGVQALRVAQPTP